MLAAGPFDLGVVVSRVAVHINTETALVIAVSDPLPRILFGVPVDLRDIRVDLDRPGFSLAPTSCEPKSVGANVFGTAGSSAALSYRFQVGGCGALGFKPGISLKMTGGTRRAAHPALKAVVTYPKGAYANVARASVALPHSEFLEQAHIRTICTRVQFAADACPKGGIRKKGLLVNSRNICKHTNRATAKFTAHNGKVYGFRPVLQDSCKRGKRSKK